VVRVDQPRIDGRAVVGIAGGDQDKLKGKDAVLRTNSNDDQGFRERAKFPAAPGPVTVTPQPDGTAQVSNGKTTWVLAQEDRYGKITVIKRK
jgi:hypothetical protein